MRLDLPHPQRSTHGSGQLNPSAISKLGKDVVFEPGVMVWHPENIEIGDNVYIGHNAMLKGYYKNKMVIGANTWIGQMCFFHSGGGIEIGCSVGIGPGVKILTLQHEEDPARVEEPVILYPQRYERVVIEDGCDIGVGSIVLPGVRIGEGAMIGAGSVVTKDVAPYTVVVGNPARFLRMRKGK